MKSRRALNSIVGALFSIIALVSVVTYVTYSTNTVEKLNSEIISKNTELIDQAKEEVVVMKSETVGNKFNITVQNTGSLPLNITRLWIQNKTDPSWGTYKYDINVPVSPGKVASNVGQGIDLYTMDTQGYEIKLTTERGNAVAFSINSPTQESLGMQLVSTPDTIPTDFTTSIIYQVTNNMANNNMLLNLQPQLSTSGTADPTQISGPTPASYPSLARGDTATFVWVYKLTGDEGTFTTFNATLTNAKEGNWATATVTVKEPLYSIEAGTSVESESLGVGSLDDGLLLFHNETSFTPGGAYQMYSADADAGPDGKRLQVDLINPKFFTNNGTNPVSISQGSWTASLKIRSEAVPDRLLIGTREDMIFHFEDGQGANPDNSQGDALDLVPCGTTTVASQPTVTSSDDAEQNTNNGQMRLTD